MVPTCLARRKKEKAVVAGGRLRIYVWGKKIKRKTRKVETIDLSGLSFEWGYCFRQRLPVVFQNDIFCRGFSPVSVVSHIICADGGSVSVFLHLLRKQGEFLSFGILRGVEFDAKISSKKGKRIFVF